MATKINNALEKTGDNLDLCYHCGLPAPEVNYYAEINDQQQLMCCAGCKAVAEAIVASGMASYYSVRESSAQTAKELVPEFLTTLQVYDNPKVQQQFVHKPKDADALSSVKEISLILEGIVCSACIWLNEQYLSQVKGILAVKINYTTHRATVRWDDNIIKLSEILEAVSRIGYLAYPYDVQKQQQVFDEQRTLLLKQLGISALFGMQVMMFAVALYSGEYWGISESYKILFQWLSLFLTMPVLFYAAKPFFKGALTDVSHGRAGMDVPVTLGIGLAFSASVYNTSIGQGSIYFESVCMFVFLLLSVRYIEFTARKKSAETIERLADLTPAMANKLDESKKISVIPIADLNCDDLILVRAGENVPADGILKDKEAFMDEALLTGESEPVKKKEGDKIIAGSINCQQSIEIKITHIGQDTILSSILRLIERAQQHKPRMAQLADRVAAKFVLALLVLVTVTAFYWYFKDPSQIFEIIIATLVVTCPCALSLATPAAISAAIGRSSSLGVLVAKPDVLEQLPTIDVFLFDKTGTLTQAKVSLDEIKVASNQEEEFCLALACALEQRSEHPIAAAFSQGLIDNNKIKQSELSKFKQVSSKGLTAQYIGIEYFLGSRSWFHSTVINNHEDDDIQAKGIYLFTKKELLATFLLKDPLKADAKNTIQALQAHHKKVVLLSGDAQNTVAHVAQQLGISEFLAEQTPEQKLAYLQSLQQQGFKVAMVGDGINDAPVLAAADVAIALSQGTDLATASADLIVQGERTQPIVAALNLSNKLNVVIKQNFAWAIGYNVVAIPFAVSGLVPPWLAAIGMSLSSLVVVLNAKRLN